MLYLVPQGANDDWYWIMATLLERQSNKQTYVVTNDLMRDHRVLFDDPLTFLRWRTSQIMHFHLSRGIDNEFSLPEIYFFEPSKIFKKLLL